MKHLRVAVLVSGGGRSYANLLKAESFYTTYKIACVVCSNSTSPVLQMDDNIPKFIKNFTVTTPADESALVSNLRAIFTEHQVDLIALAGFIKKFPQPLSMRVPIINIHPALLPKYGGQGMYGIKVHETVLLNKDKVSGATIHYVNDEYDAGERIAQVRVDISGCQSADDIAAKVFQGECDLYPKVLHKFAIGELPAKDKNIYEYDFNPQN